MDTTTQKLADALRAIAAQGYLDTGLSDAEYVTYWSALALKHRKIAKEALAALKTSDSQKNTEALKGQQPRHEDVSEALHDLRKHMKAHLKIEPKSEMTAYWLDNIDKILTAYDAALKQQPRREDVTTAWMIELGGYKMPMWYSGQDKPGMPLSIICAFTPDPCGGLRYPTKEAAEYGLTRLRWSSSTLAKVALNVTEHQWGNTPAAPRHEGAEDARDAAMTFDEAVNCAWHVAGTTLHSREDIRAAIKAIWPLPVRPRDIGKRCPACDGFGFKRDEGTKDGQD